MVVCTKKLLVLARLTRFGGFSQNAIVLATFAKNLVKTLKHGSLHKKVASFSESDTFWWFFTKCHSFCNFLLKIWSKP